MIDRFIDTIETHDENFDPPEIATVNILRLTHKIITTLVNNISSNSDYCDTNYAFAEARRKEHTSNHVVGKILEIEKILPEVSPY